MTLHIADASAFGPLLFADERDAALPGFEELVTSGFCIVPGHWRLEVTNQLLMGLRRRRLTEEAAEELLDMLHSLPIETDLETGERVHEIYSLASRYKLTIYDAAYLELAMRAQGTLVTFDKKLRLAAIDSAIGILPA